MLVTVVVVTYNSSRYVLHTLESAYRQTYGEIELIVSDDCSQDNTFEICQEWVDAHKDRFVSAKVCQTKKNGGICHNYNHALSLSSGEYIKYIAGDDILEDNCIERFVANIRSDVYLYTSYLWHLQDETGERECYSTRLPDATAYKQARFMLRYLYGINGPSIFVNREKLIEIGGFDEEFPLVEDWPIAMKFLIHNMRIENIQEPLVNWRIYGGSISHSNHAFADSLQKAVFYYTQQCCLRYRLPLHAYHHWLNHWIRSQSKINMRFMILGYMMRIFDVVNLKRKFCPIPSSPYKSIQIQKSEQNVESPLK